MTADPTIQLEEWAGEHLPLEVVWNGSMLIHDSESHGDPWEICQECVDNNTVDVAAKIVQYGFETFLKYQEE